MQFFNSIKYLAVRVKHIAKELCSLELLGLCTVLLPVLLASIGFFFGKSVCPSYFYIPIAFLSISSLCTNWKIGLYYLLVVAACSVITAFTFSYVGPDAQNYHFPMQYLLHNGWNPVFDSTIEKFSALAGDAQLGVYHTLFLPKFSSLCGAIVASAYGLFSADSFLGYVLVFCLFSSSLRFARRYWSAGFFWRIAFSLGITFSPKITSFLAGQVDYSTYATFCIAMLMLLLYMRDRRMSDLAVFLCSICICMASKTTGILSCFVLVILTIPTTWRRIEYWRILVLTCSVLLVICASPFLTAWIQYGSPFYPSMTFNPNIQVVDITDDFTGNNDALSMGYLSRICYAWISPKMTIAVIRLFGGNPSFSPVFNVRSGVAGMGGWFNVLLLTSVALLFVSRKNSISWICVVVFISSNFAPLKYIGYNRYFPQIWAIFPLAVLNFVFTFNPTVNGHKKGRFYMIISTVLAVMLIGISTISILRTAAMQGRLMAFEKIRQDFLCSFPTGKNIKVDDGGYRFTNVARFRQAGLNLTKTNDGNEDVDMSIYAALPSHSAQIDRVNTLFPVCTGVKQVLDFQWCELPNYIPHVLFD